MRTQVGIIGAGPAGLMLSHLLHSEGIDSVILESRDRTYVESRIRAGLLEQGTVDLLNETGMGERMRRQSLYHRGVRLRFDNALHRIDFVKTAGRAVTIYAQHEIIIDLIAARLAAGGQILFKAEATSIPDYESDRPSVRFAHQGREQTLDCDFVAGCDGFHGIARETVPAAEQRVLTREFPFGWLGILAEAPPGSEELIYSHSEHGFALLTMRSPTLSRLYLQVDPDDDIGNWPDARIWEQLHRRLVTPGYDPVNEGPMVHKAITPMRSFVLEPMRFGRLFIAGDAAHIVPPTGAKGLNLAVADVRVLARALVDYYKHGHSEGIERYSETCLKRVWRAEQFSCWMTSMFHRFGDDPFEYRRQVAELTAVVTSEAGSTYLAENYTGLPFAAVPGA